VLTIGTLIRPLGTFSHAVGEGMDMNRLSLKHYFFPFSREAGEATVLNSKYIL
jgi:hypothetical protein